MIAAMLAVISSAMAGDAKLPILPGGYRGFGMDTPAGSGRHLDQPRTTIYKVTNLKSSGEGSLQAAVGAEGPRIVVFEVSGYIEQPIHIKNPYITIAGQTAPWPGIVIRGGSASHVKAHDVLIQHITFRPGGKWEGSHIPHRCGLSTGGYNIVLDHCSFGWTTQVGLNVLGDKTTVIDCVFSEGFYNSWHNEPNHAKGMGVGLGHRGTQEDIAIIGNLFAHNEGRNPEVGGGTTAAVLNNVVYNFPAQGLKALGGVWRLSVIGNVYIKGGDMVEVPDKPWRGNPMWIYLMNPESKVYLSKDNLFFGETSADPWEYINARHSIGKFNQPPLPQAIASEPPVAVEGYEPRPARKTEEYVLRNVGPFPARRGPIEARLIYEVKTRTGHNRDNMEDVGGWPYLENNTRKLELPTNPNRDDDGDGYTNAEEWLHRFSAKVEEVIDEAFKQNLAFGKKEAARCEVIREPDLERMATLMKTTESWCFDAEEAKKRQQQAANELGVPAVRTVDLGDGVELKLSLIPAGEFMMGSKYTPQMIDYRGPGGNRGMYRAEHPHHPVEITEPYYIGQFEFTNQQWQQVTGKPCRTSRYRKPEHPANGVNYVGVREFIKLLNEKFGKKANLRFRLPTEAEWEYACRAGTDTPFWCGENISTDLANYNGALWDGQEGEKGRKMVTVGNFKPNAFGLYDTIGNADELVSDIFKPFANQGRSPEKVEVDPEGPEKPTHASIRVYKGGSFKEFPAECRSAGRSYYLSHRNFSPNGFRIAAQPAGQR
jgi:formylglycine-generating enzyme required for sulfatase activity